MLKDGNVRFAELKGGEGMEIEDVKKDLGDDASLFDFEEKDGVVAAKLKKFYRDRNEFAKIAQRVKDNAGGVYVPKDQGGPYFTFKGEGAKSTVTNVTIDYVGSIHQRIETIRRALLDIEAELEKLKELQK